MSTHDAPVVKPDQQRPQTQPVRHPWAVTAQRMLGRCRQQRLGRCPHRVHHLGLERAHDVG